MAKINFPVTSAIRFLKSKKLEYIPHIYEYEAKGGTKQTAKELNIDEYNVIKTLVFQSEKGELIVLMHGTLEVSTKELSRFLNTKSISQCNENVATKATGYNFGGTSPFGTRKILPIYVEETILSLDKIYINGGKQGFILEMSSKNLLESFPNLTKVNVGINK